MSRTVTDMVPEERRNGAAAAVRSPAEVLLTLVRREFCEHRAL